MKRAGIIAIAMLIVSACSGPRTPLTVGVKEINTDVLIGPEGPTPRPVPPPSRPVVGFPGFVQPPSIPPPGPKPPPPPFCPTAKPFSTVKNSTTTVAHEPPVARTYTFRDSGTFKVGARTGTFPALSTRRIENVVDPAEGGGFAFDVTIPGAAGESTTTTYHVYPAQPNALATAPGIYIEQVVTHHTDGTDDVFQPVPSLLLTPFPAAVDTSWDARGVDPINRIVMEYGGRIASRGVVDACGTKLEAWVVDITNGQIRTATTDLTFSATLFIAPQYGGISLLDKVERKGTENDEAVEIVLTSKITREPELVA